MSEIINIALVDDEPLYIEGLSLLLSNIKRIDVVYAANTGIDFLNFLDKSPKSKFPDIVLVDIQMKPMNGFDLVESLREKYPDLKIVILSSQYKSNVLGHMIKLGVSAFIPKNTNKESLLAAIDSVHSSGVYFSQTDHEMLMKYLNGRPKKQKFNNIETLSPRETEVLKLICLENTNQEIAVQLNLSKRTVESHRQRILDKVGARNTVGLVVYAIANEIHSLA